MTEFLESQGIFDKDRLPTNAILAVISALYSAVPPKPDDMGSFDTLMKKYIWRSFFTDRYENSAASRASADYKALKNILSISLKDQEERRNTESSVPVFNETDFPITTFEQLKSVKWAKQENIKGRGILAISNLLGAYDFADGSKVTRSSIRKRDYHHIFPDALLKEAGIGSYLALNCALISGPTNKTIGRKDPLDYLKDRYKWNSEDIINQRLKSHLIPINELSNGGYDDQILKDNNIDKKTKIKKDFDAFISSRAMLFDKAVKLLCSGKDISSFDFYTE